jgi:hypothetical protein
MAKLGLRLPGLGRGELNTDPAANDSWFVDSNGNAGSGRSANAPVATIDEAINLASAYDTIFVLPGHAETLADATSLVPDVANVSIIGLGRGAARPTLTLSATGSNIPISAAGVSIENILITTTGTINVTAAITVTGVDCVLKGIEIRESAATSQVVDGIVAGATSDRLHVDGLVFRGHASGDADASAVSITGAVDGVIVENSNLDGLFVAAGVENVTGVCTNAVIRNNIIRNRHATTDACITMVATSTGYIANNLLRTATNDANGFNLAVVGADMQWYENYVVNLDGETGGLVGTASAAA